MYNYRLNISQYDIQIFFMFPLQTLMKNSTEESKEDMTRCSCKTGNHDDSEES